jgi:mannose-6-phosphate isomerase-like protein (cupin superfamily)
VQTVTISDARTFSLRDVQRRDLVKTATLHVELLCFEAGQRDDEAAHAADRIYQVLEGEALVRGGPETTRLGKGTLLTVPAGVSHTLENAGGGLLVVMATGAPAQS